MGLLRLNLLRLDAFHCALLVAIVLLAVYVFGSFREGYTKGQGAKIAHTTCVRSCINSTGENYSSAASARQACDKKCNVSPVSNIQ